MTRIFTTLASLNALALLVSFGLGFLHGTRSNQSLDPPPDAHFLVGLFTTLYTLMVHCLIFTYFLGTGRWVKEVARAYELPDAELPRQTREFKRKVFPPALLAMLSAIAAVASGAGAQTQTWPWWIHATLGTLTLFVNGWAFMVEYRTVASNHAVLEQVVAEVRRIRGEA